jgi:dTMP kinase
MPKALCDNLMPRERGRFITLEGIDGAGKSTHAAWVAEHIRACGRGVVATREPGGTPLGETLRGLLLNETMTRDTEALLMFAARREHLDLVIRPALERGDWVVCDRFTDATYAYQGGGHGMPAERIHALEQWTHADCQPHLTLLFDVPAQVSRSRLDSAQSAGRALDKFEREATPFFTRVRNAYLERAKALPQRVRVIDSTRPVDVVRAEVIAHLDALGLRQ